MKTPFDAAVNWWEEKAWYVTWSSLIISAAATFCKFNLALFLLFIVSVGIQWFAAYKWFSYIKMRRSYVAQAEHEERKRAFLEQVGS